MTDDEEDPIGAVVRALAAEDAERAEDARAALEWLTFGEGPGVITQERVQTFLWYGLPMKWLTDTDHHRRVVHALARAFDMLEMPRYAAICRSSTTAGVLDAYERDDVEGRKAFGKAEDASGVRPPDIAEVEWGEVMGPEENSIRSATAEFLELADAGGDLVPGGRGWRRRQAELVRAFVTSPRPERDGRSYLDVIRAERLESWLAGRRSPTRRRLLEPLGDVVRHPVPLPRGAEDPLPPLRWLLGELVDGQPLTGTGNLNRAFVQVSATRFGWWNPGLHSLPRSEDELYDLHQVRMLAQRVALARRSGRKLVLSSRGRTLLEDPEALWRAAAKGVLHPHVFLSAVGENTLALLAARDVVSRDELHATIARIVGEEGWRERDSGDPPDARNVASAAHATTGLFRALGLLSVGDHWRDDAYGLTEVGRATALEALHGRATGPRAGPLR